MPIAFGGPAHVTRGAIASAEVAKARAFNDSLLFDPNRRRFGFGRCVYCTVLVALYKILESRPSGGGTDFVSDVAAGHSSP
jgi:hypothetical protein